jgi:hypothetical protein
MLSALWLALVLAAPVAAHAQGWSTPSGTSHIGWLYRQPAQVNCCPAPWRWYILRLRAYPQTGCYGYKGTLEPYDHDGLMLPPTSRPGALPVSTNPGMQPASPSPYATPESPSGTVPPESPSSLPGRGRGIWDDDVIYGRQ